MPAWQLPARYRSCLLAIGLTALTGAPVRRACPLPGQEPLSTWMLATLGIFNVLPMIFLVIGLWTARACFKRFARGVLRRLRHSGPAQFSIWAALSAATALVGHALLTLALSTFSAGALLHCVFGPLADADVRGDAVGDGGDDQPRPVIGGRKRSVRMTKFIHRRHGQAQTAAIPLRVREDLHGGQVDFVRAYLRDGTLGLHRPMPADAHHDAERDAHGEQRRPAVAHEAAARPPRAGCP